MGRLYFILIAFTGMFGCMATNLSTIGSSRESRPAQALSGKGGAGASQAAENADPAPADGDAIVLTRESDGHFYADVEVNGVTINMLVDTGASGVALSAADARRAGIATTIGMNDHIGEGAGGRVYGNVVEIDRINLGGVEAHDLTGVVLNGGTKSLLGQEFLRQFDSVAISGDKMELR